MGTLSAPFCVNGHKIRLLIGALLRCNSALKVPQGCPNLGGKSFWNQFALGLIGLSGPG